MDRRALLAIMLMMVIAIVPAIFLRPDRPAVRPDSLAVADSPPIRAEAPVRADTAVPAAPTADVPADQAPVPVAEDTVLVRSGLYVYGFSTRGARLVTARLADYPSLVPGEARQPVELLHPGGDLLGLRLIEGRDTLRLDHWHFEPSAPAVEVSGRTPLRFTAGGGGRTVELTYTFDPDDYRVRVDGRVSGVGSNGALLLVGMGPGIRNTEADSAPNARELAVVTRGPNESPERHNFHSMEPGRSDTLSGPFEWVAIKSKYFVTAVFADSTAPRISGASATPAPTAGKDPATADLWLSMPLAAAGAFDYLLYAGPLKYDRLKALGHEFDDVNPYGWPGFRTLVRFFAVPIRWLLVWMHENLNLAYGLVLVAFGVLVRIVLWPLNQKAMRSTMAMQAIQPQMKEIQERYKENPQKQQQEMFKLYKEHGVNPLGGCWPMLLPWPVLIALFFVFQNTIELRGVPFLWIPDLARHDPYYVIPVLLGLSMYALSKVGQMGMEPNPQMKMMLYVMPVFMTVLFVNFAAGLNLYYLVSNIVSVPQQWLLARERQRRGARMIAEVKTRAPAGEMTGKKKRR